MKASVVTIDGRVLYADYDKETNTWSNLIEEEIAAYKFDNEMVVQTDFMEICPVEVQIHLLYLLKKFCETGEEDSIGWLERILRKEEEKTRPCVERGMKPAEDGDTCIGYGISEDDDEPCEMCKECPICEGNDREEEE